MHGEGGRDVKIFDFFAYVIIPNQERVVKKLEKLLKHSYLN